MPGGSRSSGPGERADSPDRCSRDMLRGHVARAGLGVQGSSSTWLTSGDDVGEGADVTRGGPRVRVLGPLTVRLGGRPVPLGGVGWPLFWWRWCWDAAASSRRTRWWTRRGPTPSRPSRNPPCRRASRTCADGRIRTERPGCAPRSSRGSNRATPGRGLDTWRFESLVTDAGHGNGGNRAAGPSEAVTQALTEALSLWRVRHWPGTRTRTGKADRPTPDRTTRGCPRNGSREPRPGRECRAGTRTRGVRGRGAVTRGSNGGCLVLALYRAQRRADALAGCARPGDRAGPVHHAANGPADARNGPPAAGCHLGAAPADGVVGPLTCT